MLAKFGTNSGGITYVVVKFWTNTSGTTYNWPNSEPMQVEFYLAGEITQVIDSIPWVRCPSGNVYENWVPFRPHKKSGHTILRVKKLNCWNSIILPIKTCARRALSQWKNWVYWIFVSEKNPKNTKKTVFWKTVRSVVFGIFFQNETPDWLKFFCPKKYSVIPN